MRNKLGICQWFHYEDYETVERSVDLLNQLQVKHLRTGISWADFHRTGGEAWSRWMLEQLQDFEVLLSIWHTPPSIAEGDVCNGPPRRLLDFRDFIWQVNDEFGEHFSALELWNEPNNRYKWNFLRFDPQWEKFGAMIAAAGKQAKADGKTTVLGGMIPVDHQWLKLMDGYGALNGIDIVAIHGFPEMWWPDHPNWEWAQYWHGWRKKVEYIAAHCDGRPVWITETGLATWNVQREVEDRFELQEDLLRKAACAPTQRVYWYSLIDLHPDLEAIEGFHVDENEYHLGLVAWDGRCKPGFFAFQDLLQQSAAEVSADV